MFGGGTISPYSPGNYRSHQQSYSLGNFNSDTMRNLGRPLMYRSPENQMLSTGQNPNQSNLILDGHKRDDPGAHLESNTSKDQVIKEAYRDAYQQAYQDALRESQKQKEQYRNELLEKVEEKRKMLEMIKSSASRGQVEEERTPPTATEFRVETEKLKGSYEQERIAQLEKVLEKKKKREKYKLREESQQIIDNYYKNLFKPNARDKDENMYYKTMLLQGNSANELSSLPAPAFSAERARDLLIRAAQHLQRESFSERRAGLHAIKEPQRLPLPLITLRISPFPPTNQYV